jgi:hypothetical protein
MPLCKARHCDKYLYFECEKRVRFYRPYRCGEKAVKGEKVCETCKNIAPSKTQLSRGFPHGLVGEPIPFESHAYGSIWYLTQVAKYGQPSKETLAEATEYLEEPFDVTAGAGINVELFREESLKETKKTTMPPKAGTTNRKRSSGGNKKKENSEEITEPVTKTAKQTPPYLKESSANAAKKQRDNVTYIIPRVREAFIEPVDVCEVEYVDIAEFTFNDHPYYRNTKTNELYEVMTNKGMGTLVGLYDEEAEEIQLCKEEED